MVLLWHFDANVPNSLLQALCGKVISVILFSVCHELRCIAPYIFTSRFLNKLVLILTAFAFEAELQEKEQ